MSKKKTIFVGIVLTESFLQKLTMPKDSPENGSAHRQIFMEMQRCEADIKKGVAQALEDYQAGALEWDEDEKI